MAAYYNEIDPFAAAWLRELIKAGHIADGEVDERSIADVSADDVRGFTQCHWFAGIGGWSYALRLAGWPDDRPVWTGSCPCQPWSVSGFGKGSDDPRHLWPTWFKLVSECCPPTVFGEQVASLDGLYWLDMVYVALEAANYAVGAVDFAAAGVGAPHGRQRLWFVADAISEGRICCPVVSNEHGTEGTGRTTTERRTHRQAAKIRQTSGSLPSKWVPQPEAVSLADGLSSDVGYMKQQLKGFGNAIVPQVAQAFIEAYLSL